MDRQARFIEDIHALMHRDASMRQTAFTITSAFMIAVQTLLLHQGRMHDIAYKWKHSYNDISSPIQGGVEKTLARDRSSASTSARMR